MRTIRFGYILQIVIVVVIILVAGGQQLPKYASRLTVLAVLAVIDMLYWFSVKKSFTRRYKKVLTTVYWLPLMMLLVFFLAGFFISSYRNILCS